VVTDEEVTDPPSHLAATRRPPQHRERSLALSPRSSQAKGSKDQAGLRIGLRGSPVNRRTHLSKRVRNVSTHNQPHFISPIEHVLRLPPSCHSHLSFVYLVDQTGVSWNRIKEWIKRVDALKTTA
jgi:hypothetical protein